MYEIFKAVRFSKVSTKDGKEYVAKAGEIEEIMKLCQLHIPNIFVVAPTNSSNNLNESNGL
mgnify:CR=1 FL=1